MTQDPTTTGKNGELIPVSEANDYITAFLNNHYDANSFGKVNVKSFIFDADLLREYLSNTSITDVKLMLGERDHSGTKYPTIIFTGYDANGNYVKAGPNHDMVADHCAICPPNCPTVGTASNDLIV